MAKLSEQSRIVKVVYERPMGIGTYHDNLLDYFQENPVFNGESSIKKSDQQTDDERCDRQHKINTLIRSCVESKFIEPVSESHEEPDMDAFYAVPIGFRSGLPKKTVVRDQGYHATGRGTDLLTWPGYMTILFEKHSKVITFFYGILTAIIVWLATWMLGHYGEIIAMFSY